MSDKVLEMACDNLRARIGTLTELIDLCETNAHRHAAAERLNTLSDVLDCFTRAREALQEPEKAIAPFTLTKGGLHDATGKRIVPDEARKIAEDFGKFVTPGMGRNEAVDQLASAIADYAAKIRSALTETGNG